MAKRKDTRKYSDRAVYLKGAVVARRRVLKQRAAEVFGGACMICGYHKHQGVLEFHHLDATTKSFSISGGGFSRSWAKLRSELLKCILVCANCHREIELGLHDSETVRELASPRWRQIDQPLA
jgi:hypothetical protein